MLSERLGVQSPTSAKIYISACIMDARTQEKDLYLFPCFPPTVPAFQLPTGNAAHFSIEKCDSNKTYVSFVGGSETL